MLGLEILAEKLAFVFSWYLFVGWGGEEENN